MPDTIDPTTTPDPDRTAFTAGLRSLADWLDEHPEVALPHPTLRIYGPYGAKAIPAAAAFARARGECVKGVDESLDRFTLTRQFGPVAVQWSATRSDVCEKRTVTKTVEEWVCPDSLLREADERAEAEAATA